MYLCAQPFALKDTRRQYKISSLKSNFLKTKNADIFISRSRKAIFSSVQDKTRTSAKPNRPLTTSSSSPIISSSDKSSLWFCHDGVSLLSLIVVMTEAVHKKWWFSVNALARNDHKPRCHTPPKKHNVSYFILLTLIFEPPTFLTQGGGTRVDDKEVIVALLYYVFSFSMLLK
jgi:hypothetical protein